MWPRGCRNPRRKFKRAQVKSYVLSQGKQPDQTNTLTHPPSTYVAGEDILHHHSKELQEQKSKQKLETTSILNQRNGKAITKPKKKVFPIISPGFYLLSLSWSLCDLSQLGDMNLRGLRN